MSYSNGIIDAPVGVYDIRSAVSHTSGDLGTLIMNGTINKWARYKPVRLPAIDTTDEWDRTNSKWKSTSDWWKGDGKCGFAIQEFTEFGASLTTTGTFMYKLINQQLGWTYQRPQGGAQQPFRYLDFAKYNRNAIQPYGEIGATRIYIDNNGNAQIDWEISYVDDLNLKLTDFSISSHPLTDFYLGIILWKNNQWRVYTSSAKFGAGETLSITMTGVTSLAGTWNMMPFFSLKQATSDTGFGGTGNLFISFADTTQYSIELTRDGSVYLQMPYGEWNQAGTQVSYSIDIVNDTSSSFTLSSLVITIYGGSAQGTDIGHVTLSNVTVSANTTRTLTGTITATKSGYGSYWIVAAPSGTTLQQKYSEVEDYGGMIE